MGLTFTTIDEPDLTIPEDMIVRATLAEIKQRTIKWVDKQSGEAKERDLLEWYWQVQTPEKYSMRKIKGECDAKISNSPGNKFMQWASTLLGREIPVGMAVDVDDLLGLPADLTVKHDPDRKDPSKVWERVDEVIAVNGFQFDAAPPF